MDRDARDKWTFFESDSFNGVGPWSCDMHGPAQKMGGEVLRLGKNPSVSSRRVATPCVDDHPFLPEACVDFRQYCRVGSSTEDCKLGSFQDASCAGDVHDSKSTSSGVLSLCTAHIRSDCLDVQNMVSGVPQQLRIGNYLAGCRFTHGGFASSAGLGMSETDVN